MHGRKLLSGEFTDGMDLCGAWSSGQVVPDVSLEFEYGSDPAHDRHDPIESITGHSVRIYRIPQCVLAWNQGPSGMDGQPAQVVTLTAPDCAQGRRLVATAIHTLDRRPPAMAAKPQSPLTFRADQPDVAAAGACVDLQTFGKCEPYVDVPVPEGTTEIRRHVAADPHVNCALAVAAVRKELGGRFRPVVDSALPIKANGKTTVNSRCVFVEPSHATRILVLVSDAAGPRRPDSALTVAGRAARLADDSENSRSLLVAIGDHPEDGELLVSVAVSPSRGTHGDPDPAPLRSLTPLARDIVAKYF